MDENKYPGLVGRPPKNPIKRVNRPVRALVSAPVAAVILDDAAGRGLVAKTAHGTISSDIIRLYVARGLMAAGLWTREVAGDPTWDSLKDRGLL